MIVSELIQRLSSLPSDLEVLVSDGAKVFKGQFIVRTSESAVVVDVSASEKGTNSEDSLQKTLELNALLEVICNSYMEEDDQ